MAQQQRRLPPNRTAASSHQASSALATSTGFTSLLLAVAWTTHSAAGLPYGTPPSACADMMPLHGPAASAVPSPYNLTLSARQYSAGSKITVTIHGATFRGFFVQARATSCNTSTVGVFTDFKNGTAPLDCFNTTASAVTHNSGADKSVVTLTWIAPSRQYGPVVFWATIVQTTSLYWVGVKSQSLVFNGVTPTHDYSTALPSLLAVGVLAVTQLLVA